MDKEGKIVPYVKAKLVLVMEKKSKILWRLNEVRKDSVSIVWE